MLHKDPLLHFLVIGGVLFAALSFLSRGANEGDGERILITATQVAEIAQSAALLRGREPSEDELKVLVGQLIRDEVYYRNALELGLDVDDSVVRQRMIEKMRELTENIVNPLPPDADIEAWFEVNADRFRIPELATFDQLFFSPRERGESVLADANAALAALNRGEDAGSFGDSTPLSDQFEAADDARVRVLFGESLTAAVFTSELGVWLGPFESDFGWHLVRVTNRTPSRDPTFAEVEVQVRDAYASDQLAQANAAAYADMLGRFKVSVQWSEDVEPEAWQ